MRLDLHKRVPYEMPKIVFDTDASARKVLKSMQDTIDLYGCVSVADMLELTMKPSNWMDNKYGWTSLTCTYVTSDPISTGYIIKLPRPFLIDHDYSDNNSKKEKETMKYNTLADICSKNPNARMTIGYHSFPVKIRNISCDSSDPYDSTTIITVENSGDPYAPLFKKYGDTNANCIKRVLFNDPATIVFWSDGTKTVVKCDERDEFDPEKGLAMAIAKKSMGNNYKYYEVFEKFLPRDKTCTVVESIGHGYNPIQKAYEILTESVRDLTSFDVYEVIGYLGEALAE